MILKMSNPEIWKFSFIICFLLLLHPCKATDEEFKFLIFSDIHAADMPDGKERMDTIVNAAVRENVDFIIQLGDFMRLDEDSKPIKEIWDKCDIKKYHVLGNHDMDQYSKEKFIEGFNIINRYYSFDKGEFHFIVLDANNIYDGTKYTPYGNGNYGRLDISQQNFIDPEQLEWLKKDLKETNKRCIIFSHESIERVIGNREEVRKILEDANTEAGFKKVVLSFSGHNHSNYTENINGITYTQINSASYVWIEGNYSIKAGHRYSQEILNKYKLMKRSIPYSKTLYGIVTVNKNRISMKGIQGNFIPPTPQELNLPDILNGFPLVSSIQDLSIDLNDNTSNIKQISDKTNTLISHKNESLSVKTDKIKQIQLFTPYGTLLKRQIVQNDMTEISLGEFPEGFYLLVLIGDNAQHVYKIINRL